MAERYGVSVRAFNLSREQVAFARNRAQGLGLARRVEFIQDDYRNVTGKYDVFVSVGCSNTLAANTWASSGASSIAA